MADELYAEFRRATSLRDAGDLVGAEAVLERLAGSHPESFGVWLVLGGVQAARADYAAAEISLSFAVHLRPRSELASLSLFHTLTHLGRLNDAFGEMRRFLSLRPESHEYARLRGEIGGGDIYSTPSGTK